MYDHRLYRSSYLKDRFHYFQIQQSESDLYIGINHHSYSKEIEIYSKKSLINFRKQLEEYLTNNPVFQSSHEPVKYDYKSPLIVQEMINASAKAGIGPMGCVAGAFSQFIGEAILKEFPVNELIVENGGDIYLSVMKDLDVSVFAGNSPLSEKIGVKVPSFLSPVGVCTSSGTVGHSFSYGKADAVTIVCKSTLFADAYATAYCNKIKSERDVDKVIREIKINPDILSALIIMKDKVGITGKFEFKIFEKE